MSQDRPVPLTPMQRRVYELIVLWRRIHGVGPRLNDIGDELWYGRRINKKTVMAYIMTLIEKGWLTRIEGQAVSPWVPTREARTYDKWPEVIGLVRRVARAGDPQAMDLVEYIDFGPG